jgi:AraC-like DNA-binding protein
MPGNERQDLIKHIGLVMLGYSDQAAFNNAFQHWYGVPPGRWRKESK